MDPKACLDEIREHYRAMRDNPSIDFDHGRLVDLIESLDQWMSRGGFSPWDE